MLRDFILKRKKKKIGLHCFCDKLAFIKLAFPHDLAHGDGEQKKNSHC